MTGRTVHGLDPGGCVRDWLAGPAWSAACDDLDAVLDASGSPWGEHGRWVLTNGPDVAPLKRRLYRRRPLVLDQPLPVAVEGGSFSWTAPGGGRVDTGTWERVHTGADGLVDWSRFCHTPEYRHAVAATVLEVDQAEWRTLEVACTGPFAVWVGGEMVAVRDEVSYMEPVRHSVRVRLGSGATPVLVATWQVAFRECRHVAAVRVEGPPVRVVLPSPGADEYAAAIAEQVLERVAVRSWASDEAAVCLTGPVGAALAVSVPGGPTHRVRLVDGGAAVPLRASPAGGDDTASMLETGETALSVGVDDPRCPVRRTLRVAVLPARRRGEPVGDDPAVWRDELLRHVASSRPGAARALARYELDGAAVDARDLAAPLGMVGSRADCADFEAVGVLHLLHRVPPQRWPAGERERVGAALLGFKYWIDQPGLDAMCYFTENHQLVWHTAELLAGEAFGDAVFTNTGWSGARHAEHGRALAVEWMRRKLTGGFSEFDSNAYLAIDSLALVSLVELAADVEVRAMAEALLDKVLLTLAANSWRGVHGAAHGRSYVPTLRSSRFEETAPIMWLLWGTGALNAAVLPATALALARRYRLPPVVRAVAVEPGERWYGRQVYRGEYRFAHDLLDRPYGSDLRIWRTPDAMLSSVQDYRPGLPGLQEHVWGATLGAEVQVFATLPAADTTSPSARPNAWAGQRVLPRVRQDRDALLVVYPDAADTHLWFPSTLMDEVIRRGPWLAGRVGDGYVAVAAAGGFTAVASGDEAMQAWTPNGAGSGYAALVGRRADHGPFAEFVAGLTDPEFAPATALTTPDGRRLELAWTGPFLVDGVPAGLDADGRPEHPPHLDNPAVHAEAGAARLEAAWAGHRLVLDLAAGRRLEPRSGALDDR
ncbi:hypothetical protein [Pseudonocardia acaciae]|uniref:hypothetical protein n=1 Tax=Pseudonocardia acaciae TaxID=551276 RepID=UPI00048CC483|nr:hypothetical protein [Pseudonocardia acaciae]